MNKKQSGIIYASDVYDELMDIYYNGWGKRRIAPPEKGENYFSTLRRIKKYYQDNEAEIMEHAKSFPCLFYRAYPMDWSSFFSPLEESVWQIIRSMGRIVLYPQYPALNYFIDFANPYLKIGVEVDSIKWHDEEKDANRDERLVNAGWKIFRIKSKEVYKIIDTCDLDLREETDLEKYQEMLMNTAEGVIESIKQLYFNQRQEGKRFELLSDTYYRSLHKHRLIDFEL